MSQEQLEQALALRIAALPTIVAAAAANTIPDLEFRGRPCVATPVAVLDDPDCIERAGIQYRCVIRADAAGTRHYATWLNLRIVPHRGSGDPELAARGNGAYVAFYAADREHEVDYIGYRDITRQTLFPELAAGAWYAFWVRAALRLPERHKLMQHKQVWDG